MTQFATFSLLVSVCNKNLLLKMPQFCLETNMPSTMIPRDFVRKTVKVIAKTMDRPEQLTFVCVKPDNTHMSFGGTSDICAVVTLRAIGNLGAEDNEKHSKVISDFVQKELGIPSNRMFINFVDDSPANVGYKGTTLHTLLASGDFSRLLKDM